MGTGILNVLMIYFYNKALRYGDLSLVSATRGFTPVITLPISFAIFSLLKDKTPLSNPHVTWLGFIGIMLIVGDLIINSFQSRAKKKDERIIPKGTDWFTHHPVLSGLLAASIAGLSINFDKVSVDAANPFLLGVIMPIIVFVITLFWILETDGRERVLFIFKNYWKKFVLVGMAYGLVILIMNIALFGHNVNYYSAIKRSSIFFLTLYGVFILKEGMNTKKG